MVTYFLYTEGQDWEKEIQGSIYQMIKPILGTTKGCQLLTELEDIKLAV